MKKRNLKSLKLNKQFVSNFSLKRMKGGVTFTRFDSCYEPCQVMSRDVCPHTLDEPECVDPVSLNNDCVSIFDDCYTVRPNQAC